MKIDVLKIKVRKTEDNYLFHNSKADARILMEVCNLLIEKVNEIIQELNRYQEDE